MGGQSFRCEHCGKWFLQRLSLYKHAFDKHGIKRAVIEGTGPNTTVRPRETPSS